MVTSDPGQRSLRLLIELGRGGMGVVYLALAQGPAGFAKLKVVKRLRPDLAGEPQAVQMFLEEGRLSARLHHPNVVQTNEVGFDGRHYFLEMEYLEGQSLDALLRRASRGAPLSLPLAVYVLSQTLAGLHYAHELCDHEGNALGVVHRDVSPHNVLVTYDGQVKVLDFGIAKAVGSRSETKTGFIKGKVTYMAPEQVGRQPLDRRVDVFAVGVMLWEALAGTRLWGDLDDFEIFLKLRSEAIASPRTVKSDAPEALEAICLRALARDPADRYASAAEMQRALEAWLESSGARVGSRELAMTMDALFAADRAATKAEIDERIKTTPATESVVGVPMLRAAGAVTGTGVGTASNVGGEGTRVRQQKQIRGLRTIALASLGIAVVASVAVGVVAVRNRRARAAAVASSSASSLAAAPPGCARNAECGEGEICRKDQRRCVKLATDRCTVMAEPGDVGNDRTVWIGAMFPTTGPQASIVGIPSKRAVDLVRQDFAQVAHGIPARSVDGAPRPLGIIACDDAQDERAIASHLVDDVGVPAVIGFKMSSESIDLSRDIFVPKRILVASTNFSAQVTAVPQPSDGPRLVWRTSLSSAQNAIPISRVVSDLLEPRLQKQHVVGDGKPMRVAFVRPKNQYALSMAEALLANLSFNGRSALANGDKFAQIVFGDPTDPNAKADYPSVVRQLVALAPQVIVFSGEDELVDNVFAPVEGSWRTSEPRPVWLSSTNLEGGALFKFIGADPDRRRRFFGVSAPATTPANALLAMHYNSEYPEKVTVNDTPAAPYDAAYLLAYAAFIVGDEPMSGAALARALTRLSPPGKPTDVGPTHILQAIELLRRGESIDLNGAGNRLDFDPRTGESPIDYVIQCVGLDANGVASDAIESGVTLDATSGKLRGALRCP